MEAIVASTKQAPATLPDGITATFALDVDGGTLSAPMSARTFGTGSVGFSTAGKVSGADGRRYQVSVNVVLIGSKPTA